MTDKHLPDEDNVARHCTKSDFSDDEAMWLNGGVFEPTEKNPNISVNWVEFYSGDFPDKLDQLRKELREVRTVKHNHRLAIIGVDDVKKIGEERGCELKVLHTPISNPSSHSEIFGIPLEARILHQELADAASQIIEKAHLGVD